MKTCCFTGPRLSKLDFKKGESDEACIKLKEKIRTEIEKLYNRGYTAFISGMADGIDTFCAEAVIELKKTHPEITLEAVLPYRQARRANDERFRKIICVADSVVILNENYTPDCFYNRNKYMVDKSDLLFAVYSESGGTAYTIKYAAKCDKPIKIITRT